MENKIKDLPGFVKDSKSHAILMKREKNAVDIRIDNIYVELDRLRKRIEKLENA